MPTSVGAQGAAMLSPGGDLIYLNVPNTLSLILPLSLASSTFSSLLDLHHQYANMLLFTLTEKQNSLDQILPEATVPLLPFPLQLNSFQKCSKLCLSNCSLFIPS